MSALFKQKVVNFLINYKFCYKNDFSFLFLLYEALLVVIYVTLIHKGLTWYPAALI